MMTINNRKTGAVALTALMVSCLVAQAVTINSYNNWTTVPNNTTGDVALGKTVTLCDGSLQGDSQPVSALTDGLWQTSNDNPAHSVYVAWAGNARVSIDLTQTPAITEIDTWSWHSGVRAPQEYYVWGAASPSATGTGLTFASYAFGGTGLAGAGYTLIGHVATGTASGQWTTQFSGSIGSYRYLVFDIAPSPNAGAGTFYGEIAVKGSLPSTKDMLTFTFPTLGAATISGTNINMTVPYGTNVTALAPTYMINGTSCAPLSGSSQNFSSPVQYTVKAADNSTQIYTVTVTVTPVSTAKDLLTFGLPGLPAAIDPVAKTVTWYVPHGTNLATLAPAYTVSPFATGLPATGTAPNFATTDPATYTITAQNGSTQAYLVTVIVLADVTINSYNNWTTVPNNTTGDVALGKTVTLCDGTLAGGSVSQFTDGTWQINGDNTANSVWGGLGAGQNYRVSIDLTQAYSVSEIDAWSWHNDVRAPQEYYVWGAASPTATGTDLKFNTYAFGAGLGSAGYTLLGHVTTGTASGQWTTRLSGSIGSYRYLVFDIAPAPVSPYAGTFFGEIAVKGYVPGAKDMLTFSFGALGAATITGTDITIAVPYGTDVTALSPTYMHNGISCAPLSGTAHNFTSPVHYIVTSTDSSTNDYTVTVTVTPPSTAKDILTFGPAAMPAGITGTNIVWYVPFGTNLATLASAYTVSPYASGVPATGTAPNFATNNPATYTITAQDGSTRIYHVTVSVLPDMAFNAYNNWTTVPNTTTTDNVASGKTVTLCDGTLAGGNVSRFTDGLWQTGNNDTARSVWGPDSAPKNYRVSIDLTQSYSIFEIDAWSWHADVRAPQEYYVWGAASPSATGTDLKFNTYAFGAGLGSAGYTVIGHALTGTAGGQWTTQFSGSIGNYRYLVFDIAPGPISPYLGTFFGEIAVSTASSAKNMLTFGLPGNAASIDQGTRTITWSVPYGTDLATLAPAYTVSPYAFGSPFTGVAPNFAANNPATYTVTAQNGSTQTYSVLATVLPEMPTAINVNFAGGANPGNAWMNGIQSSDAGARGSASRVAPATYSGNVWNDFSAAGSNSTSLLDSRGTLTGIGLTTTMQNGPGNTWTGLGTNRLLVSGLTSAYTGYTGIIALTGLNPAHTYNLYIASLHNTTAPTSTFRVGAVEKALTFTTVSDWTDGKTHVQFTGLIPATDGTLAVEGKSTGELVLNGFQLVDTTPQNDITSFTFPNYGAAIISGTGINIAVPYGTNLTALAPTYTLSYGATCVPASGSSQNFTSPVHYLVRASDNSTKDYTVTVTPRAIPDPQFTLTAPATWDGRQTITVQSAITNWGLLAANGGTNVNYQWNVAGVAVTKQIAAGTLTLTRAQGNGPLTVTLVMDNGGWAVTHSVTIHVQQPASDAWVYRTPAADEKPVDGQFFARDDTGFGRIYYNGTQAGATAVFLRLHTTANGVETHTSTTRQTLTNNSFAFTVPIAAGLFKYRVEFGTTSGGTDTVTASVSNLICGDAYIIEGQSNAEAGAPNNGTPPEEDYYTSDWIRSYGNVMAGGTPCTWGTAVRTRRWGSSIYGQLQIGDWGIDLAKQLLEKHNMPICIINGAVGGTRIDEHLRNEANHEDSATIYGRLLTRIEAAKLTHGIRGVFWHQGEQDQGRGGPYGGDFDYKWYQQNFVDLSAAWKQDYPNLRNYYIYQIWPAACGDTSANDMLRETQRTLPKLYSNMRVMTTIGVEPGSGCHFDLDGYQMFAGLLRPMVEQDNYGRVPDATETFTPPNLQRAWFTDASHYEIALEFDQEMDGLSAPDAKGHFYLDGVAGLVTSVSTSGKVIKLRLSAASTATTITYLKGIGWDGNQAKLLRSAKGIEIIGIDINGNNASTRTVTIAALTFANVPIASTAATAPDTFASWITDYYATPGDPNAAPDADPDGDGLKNSVEYVLGTRPDTGNQGGPVASNVGANFVFTFQRALASKNAYTKVVIEVGTDLGTWPHGYDVDTAPEVAISTGLDADHETVTLTLPRNPDTTKFARLKVITTAP